MNIVSLQFGSRTCQIVDFGYVNLHTNFGVIPAEYVPGTENCSNGVWHYQFFTQPKDFPSGLDWKNLCNTNLVAPYITAYSDPAAAVAATDVSITVNADTTSDVNILGDSVTVPLSFTIDPGTLGTEATWADNGVAPTLIYETDLSVIGWTYNGIKYHQKIHRAPIEIGAGEFGNPAIPLDSEVDTWLAAGNSTDVTDQVYYLIGSGTAQSPDFAWVDIGNNTALRMKDVVTPTPSVFVAPIEIVAGTFADPTDPQQAEVDGWVLANGTGDIGQLYYTTGGGTAANPDFMWADDGDNTATFLEKPYPTSEDEVNGSAEANPQDAMDNSVGVPGTPVYWFHPTTLGKFTGVKTPGGGYILSETPGANVTVLPAAFANVHDPQEAEVDAWIAANEPDLPAGTVLETAEGFAFILSMNGASSLMDRPMPILPVEIPAGAFADAAAPTTSEASTWVTNNGSEIPGQLYYVTGIGSVDDPQFVWANRGDGTVVAVQNPLESNHQNPFVIYGADPATAFATIPDETIPGSIVIWNEPVTGSVYAYTVPVSGTPTKIEERFGTFYSIPDVAFSDVLKPTGGEVTTWRVANAPNAPLDMLWTCSNGDVFYKDTKISSPQASAPTEIPDTEFSSPAAPTTAEANAWVINNGTKVPGQLYWSDGTGSANDPEFVWADKGDGNVINIKGL